LRPHAIFVVVFIAVSVTVARAQAPGGALSGVAVDLTGAAVSGASVSITNQDTEQNRVVALSSDGRFRVDSLAAGTYMVTVTMAGFKTVKQPVSVEAGTTTSMTLVLEPGALNETVTVRAASPLLHHDQHQVDGVVGRDQIDSLPLNGRNFLELAKLEPGMTAPTRLADNRTFVAPLGAGLQTIPRIGYTRVTIDGANAITPSTVGMLLQVSQDVVQEFQLATLNFNPATGPTSTGAVNVVTRSGSNTYRGDGFLTYRDHNLSAYPALKRDPNNPDPFFRRTQFGSSVGGPIARSRAFFFASVERNDQTSVFSVQPSAPEFAALGGIFESPYDGTLVSARADLVLGSKHTVFGRYTHDGNRTFAPSGPVTSLPSGWAVRTVHADQTVLALTSVLHGSVVNDARGSYFATSTPTGPPGPEDCPQCFGLGAPRIMLTGGELVLGNAGSVNFVARRAEVTDHLTWQHGRHQSGIGFEWQHDWSQSTLADRDPAQITLWSPAQVRSLAPAVALPASLSTVDALLQLPLRSFQAAGGPAFVPQEGFASFRIQDLYRVYASDTWTIGSRVTLNAALAWSYEPNALNDLTKPALLAPLLGADRLNPPAAHSNISPMLGVAWTLGSDARTVVRAGAGQYFDPLASTNRPNLDTERLELSPLGTGRLILTSGTNLSCNGRPLDYRQPTTFSGTTLLACLPGIRADLLQSSTPGNQDFTYRNIDLRKTGTNLYDPDYATPYAVHVGAGIERELRPGLVVGADFVYRRFVNTFINGIDYNHFNSTSGPVIPVCTPAERADVTATCSNGPFQFDTTIGRARYRGLIVRVEHRLTGHAQFLASYTLGSFVGSNGTGLGTMESNGGRVFGFNNDNPSENYGPLPTDQRHILNMSGFVDLPWRLQVSSSVSFYSRPPFYAYVNGVDFNGDGTVNDLLPGTSVNELGRGVNKDDLVRLVAQYNAQYAGRQTAGGQTAPFITLPDHFSFDDNFFTQDIRIVHTFGPTQARLRLLVSADVFNVFNTANMVQYSGNIADPSTFGQPGNRSTQIFGSGGPRAVQLGVRATF
jgi:hypothetical protein